MLTRATVSHYVGWDNPERPRTLVESICGVIIRRNESAGDPTCPVCRRILAEREADDAEAAIRLGIR